MWNNNLMRIYCILAILFILGCNGNITKLKENKCLEIDGLSLELQNDLCQLLITFNCLESIKISEVVIDKNDTSEIKSDIRNILHYLEGTKNSKDTEIVSRFFLCLLQKHKSFVFPDYFLIWLGHSLLAEYSPTDELLTCLIGKIDDLSNSTIKGNASEEIKNELIQMAAELIEIKLEKNGETVELFINNRINYPELQRLKQRYLKH